MVTAVMKLCLCVYLYHNIRVFVTGNMSILNEKTREINSTELEENSLYLLKTPGCTIPNIWAGYQTIEANKCYKGCGKRAVFVTRLNDDNIIKYTIKKKRMMRYFGIYPYECCSQFAYIFVDKNVLEFTECKPFVDGTHMVLQQEVITVTCKASRNATNNYVYKDAYIVVQKLVKEARRNNGNSWNVLLMGMDTMSRGRAIQSMPKLVKYFRDNGWLDYKAFQKAQVNTYPNLMITYTGIYNHNLLSDKCKNDTRVCSDLFIWNKFKKSGYITAYAEDTLEHTFEKTLTSHPTDHYPRSLFRLERNIEGNIDCLRTRPTAYHILDYVYQYVKTYKNEKYFGSFFTSRYSHDPHQIPTLLQNQYINLFKKLNDSGALKNTIIFFYGDHGIRFGRLKIPAESYYDERLPMLYMWFPHSFRKLYEGEYHNLQLNQNRLTTHSDLHSTLWNILKLSDGNVTIIPPEYCPSCGSLMEEKSKQRRCEDMNVSVRWCSCYVLKNVSATDIAATTVPKIFLDSIKAKDGKDHDVNKILRHQWFRDENDNRNNITYYVIAVEVLFNHKQFEGVIKRQGSDYHVLLPVDQISSNISPLC